MRILLTGATGFIGSAFLRLASGRGHEVVALLRPGRLAASLPPAGHRRWLIGSLAEPPWDEIKRVEPDTCVHAAWITTPGVYLQSPENHHFAKWSEDFICRACECGVRRVVALGTCIEYQMESRPLREDETPLAPMTTYARCKNALREVLTEAAKRGGFSLAWCRIFYPYGIGEHPQRLCSVMVQELARGETVVLKTPHSTKDFIHIDDLAAALLTVTQSNASGAINLGTGKGTTVRHLAQTIAGLMGREKLVVEADSFAPDPLSFVVADASRLLALGWRPQIELQDGLARLIRHLTQ